MDPELIEACGDDPMWPCDAVFRATSNETMAKAADFLVAKPLKITVILLVAFVVSRLIRRAVNRFVAGLTGAATNRRVRRIRDRAPGVLHPSGETVTVRAAARAQTLAVVLKSAASFVVYSIALLTVLGELDINLGPLIAGAGIAGVAIGFGAQSLVKDFFSGVFMLIEDQYGVGDIIDVGEATGTVEAVTLRTTRLRDVSGTVWHVPNGQILRVGNKSQQWARALIDVPVGYSSDIRRAEEVIKRTADAIWQDERWSALILEEPEVWGVEELGPDGVVIRLVIKTLPAEQFPVMRELRVRLKEALDEAGIEIPTPQRTLWVRQGAAVEPEAAE